MRDQLVQARCSLPRQDQPGDRESRSVQRSDAFRSPWSVLIVSSLLVSLLNTTPARAHRLLAECRVLPGQMIQVEAWFDAGGGPSAGARVQAYQGDQLLTEGKLDKEGVFVFGYEQPDELRIVISAGAGHRQELSLTRAQLERGAGTATTNEPEPAPPVEQPRADRTSRVGIADGLVGIAFLLALAAFILSVRNSSELGRLKQQLDERLPPA